MKIGVVGSGAVGCYYGGLLARAGEDVHFLMRSDFETVRREGLLIKSGGAEIHLQSISCVLTPGEIGPCDAVIVASKSTTNAEIGALLGPLTRPDTLLVTLQNGLGNEEWLESICGGAERILGGLCFVCLNRTAPGVIEHFGFGRVTLGAVAGRPHEGLERMAEAFKRAGVEVEMVDRLAEGRWRKLVWNVPFNGLAIAGVGADTQVVLADPHLLASARQLMREVIAGARALGLEIPFELAELQIERTRSMGPYKPSSLIDHQLGRPVEVEAIWGEPLRRGTAAGAEMPALALLYAMLRRITS